MKSLCKYCHYFCAEGKAVKEEYLKHLHIAERAAFYGTYGQDIEGS